jgi:exodeoxyribonuclease-3
LYEKTNMKIATYNVNGVNGRLAVLMRWLEETQPDVVCLQELKAPQDNFPKKPSTTPVTKPYGTGRNNGTAWPSSLNFPLRKSGAACLGDPDDLQSRYLEAMINGVVIACLYLPNGNPAPRPNSITTRLV